MARKDSRGYALKKGESQRKDGRYVFRYTTIRGEQKAVYAKELSELRKKEVKIRRAIEDGLDPDRAERITLNELFDEYISQKYDLKQSTLTNYKYMYNHYVRVDFGKRRISKIKYTDVKKFYYSLIMEKGFKPNSMEIVNTLLHPTFTMAVRDGLLRLNPTEGVMTEIKKSHSWEKKKRHQKVIGFSTDEIDGYSGFVFCTGEGKVYLPGMINRTIHAICADYNKEEAAKADAENRDPILLPNFSCHHLRHTFCTRFCENETNLKVIQEIMGHADITTTMDVYAEATQEKKKASMTALQSALLVR